RPLLRTLRISHYPHPAEEPELAPLRHQLLRPPDPPHLAGLFRDRALRFCVREIRPGVGTRDDLGMAHPCHLHPELLYRRLRLGFAARLARPNMVTRYRRTVLPCLAAARTNPQCRHSEASLSYSHLHHSAHSRARCVLP